MSTDDEILSRLRTIQDQLSTLIRTRPHLTRVQFAEKVGLSTRTVSRRITQGYIRTEQGMIPQSELKKFTS